MIKRIRGSLADIRAYWMESGMGKVGDAVPDKMLIEIIKEDEKNGNKNRKN